MQTLRKTAAMPASGAASNDEDLLDSWIHSLCDAGPSGSPLPSLVLPISQEESTDVLDQLEQEIRAWLANKASESQSQPGWAVYRGDGASSSSSSHNSYDSASDTGSACSTADDDVASNASDAAIVAAAIHDIDALLRLLAARVPDLLSAADLLNQGRQALGAPALARKEKRRANRRTVKHTPAKPAPALPQPSAAPSAQEKAARLQAWKDSQASRLAQVRAAGRAKAAAAAAAATEQAAAAAAAAEAKTAKYNAWLATLEHARSRGRASHGPAAQQGTSGGSVPASEGVQLAAQRVRAALAADRQARLQQHEQRRQREARLGKLLLQQREKLAAWQSQQHEPRPASPNTSPAAAAPESGGTQSSSTAQARLVGCPAGRPAQPAVQSPIMAGSWLDALANGPDGAGVAAAITAGEWAAYMLDTAGHEQDLAVDTLLQQCLASLAQGTPHSSPDIPSGAPREHAAISTPLSADLWDELTGVVAGIGAAPAARAPAADAESDPALLAMRGFGGIAQAAAPDIVKYR